MSPQKHRKCPKYFPKLKLRLPPKFLMGILVLFLSLFYLSCLGIDIERSAVYFDGSVKEKYVDIFVNEVFKRSQVIWPTFQMSNFAKCEFDVCFLLLVKEEKQSLDEFVLQRSGRVISVIGMNQRSVLFGIGKLVRSMNLAVTRSINSLPQRNMTLNLSLISQQTYAASVPVRGQMISNRQGGSANTYMGWSIEQFEEYVVDMACFGNNEISMILLSNQSDSAMYQMDPDSFISKAASFVDSLDLFFSLWAPFVLYPASIPSNFTSLARLDRIYIPGGDGGTLSPHDLLYKAASSFQSISFPYTQIFVSTQDYNGTWQSEFFDLINTNSFAFLDRGGGVFYGPHTRLSVEEYRKALKKSIPLVGYPDVCHGMQSQFPNNEFPMELAFTEGRGMINVRPNAMEVVFRHLTQHAELGFFTYSEGAGDDVNKVVWSCMGWNESLTHCLSDYERMFGVNATLIVALEQNWLGPMEESKFEKTLQIALSAWNDVMGTIKMKNWRLQMYMYRAYFDSFVMTRRKTEESVLANVVKKLSKSSIFSVKQDVIDSLKMIENIPQWEPGVEMQVFAARLFQAVSLQLGYIYGGHEESGNSLDTSTAIISNIPYFNFTLSNTLNQNASQTLEIVTQLIQRRSKTSYNDLGSFDMPNLVRSNVSYAEDPSFYRHSVHGFHPLSDASKPIEWSYYEQSMYNYPLNVRFLNVARGSSLVIVYAGSPGMVKCDALLTNGTIVEIHPLIEKPLYLPTRFQIPSEAIEGSGEINVLFNTVNGIGSNGRATQIAELWID